MAQSRRVSFATTAVLPARRTSEATGGRRDTSARVDEPQKNFFLDNSSRGGSERTLLKEGQPLHTKFNDEGVLEPFLTKVQKENCKAAAKLLQQKLQGSAGKKLVHEEFAMLEVILRCRT